MRRYGSINSRLPIIHCVCVQVRRIICIRRRGRPLQLEGDPVACNALAVHAAWCTGPTICYCFVFKTLTQFFYSSPEILDFDSKLET